MRVFMATDRSQGDRPDDFHGCITGELLWIPESCDYDGAERRRCRCGCARGFAGLATGRLTTTAVVAELDMTVADYVDFIARALESRGWPPEWADGDVSDMLEVLGSWEVGDVIERSGLTLGRRFHPRTGALLAPLHSRGR